MGSYEQLPTSNVAANSNTCVTRINGRAVPAYYSYGNITVGTGNITTFSSNNTVIGNSTFFVTELGNGFVLRDSANVYIGKIGNIISNTSATLTANANIALANLEFKYQSFTVSEIVNDPTLGIGNITTFSNNNKVIGSNTSFLTQLAQTFQIFENVNNVPGNLIGVIQRITSNTEAELTTVSGYPGEVSYRFYDPFTESRPKIFN